MRIRGQIQKITYYNQENGYSVVRIHLSDEDLNRLIEEEAYDELYSNYLTVVSNFTTLPELDTDYEFEGDFEESKYGLQFRSKKTIKSVKQSKDGIIRYLSSSLFKGVGPKTAKKIYDKLQDEALKKILEDKDCLKGLGLKQKTIDLIYDTLKASYSEEESIVEMLSLGLSFTMANKIYKTLKDDSLRVIKENPYALIDKIEGIGFLRADDIAFKQGIKRSSPYRLKALIMYVLENKLYNDGDTYIKKSDLYKECLELEQDENKDEYLNLDSFDTFLEELIKEHKIILSDDGYVSLVLLDHRESEIARLVCDILRDPSFISFNSNEIDEKIRDAEYHDNMSYSLRQKEAIKRALTEPISIITGGPGTGKSTIIRALIEVYTFLHKTEVQDIVYSMITLCAPTGRAAKRLRELTNHSASTIHKLLGYTGKTFTIDKVDAKLLIVDEFSMVDINLAYHLFKAIKKGTTVVIVGDSDQLPAVGPGDVLNDLILSKEISVTRLDKVHRQALDSSIISLAHDVNKGTLPPDICTKLKDRSFLRCDDDNIIAKAIYAVDAFIKSKEGNVEIEKKARSLKIDPKTYILVNDLQVLVPMYRGRVGIDSFNSKLQEYFNPKEDEDELVLGFKKYRIKDKVIQLVNRSDKDIMNGDIGFISSFIKDEGVIKGLNVCYQVGEVSYDIDELEEIKLAYAISVHKAQGSEFEMAICPFSFRYYIMLKRKLIYTEITRAKKYLILVGNFEALRKGINLEEEKRKTRLIEKVKLISNNPNVILDEDMAFKELKEEHLKEIEDGNIDFEDIEAISPYDFL